MQPFSGLSLFLKGLAGQKGWQATVAQPRAQARLRCHHRRRRRPRSGHRLLPRRRARPHQYRGARERLDRRRQHRAQHHDHPLELPVRRKRRALRPRGEAVGGPLPGTQLQRHVLAARRDDARAHRARHAGAKRHIHANRCQRRRQRMADARGGQGLLPAAEHRRTSATRCSAPPCSAAAAPRGTTRWPGAMRARPMRSGVDIIENCEVTGIRARRAAARSQAVETTRGRSARRRSASSPPATPASS